MSWELSFMFVFGLFGVMFLFVNTVESIKNFKENKILGERYKKQKYYMKDLNACPKCGHPYLFCRITKEVEGWEPFIPKMYSIDEFDCYNDDCNFKIEVIRKWNKQKWCYE